MPNSARVYWLRRAYSFKGEPGLEWNDKAEIVSVLPGSQSHSYGIEPGWKIVEVNGDPIRCKGGSIHSGTPHDEHPTLAKKIAERIRLSSAHQNRYTVTFLFPLPDLDERLIKEQEHVLSNLRTLRDEDRLENLAILESLNDIEKSMLLQRPKACAGLLSTEGDELTVLFGEIPAAKIQQNRAALKRLSLGSGLDEKTLKSIDFEYSDPSGDTVLHRPVTSSTAGPVLAAAARQQPKSLFQPNKEGARPLEALIRRCLTSKDRETILRMVAKLAPRALDLMLSDGGPLELLLGTSERKMLKEIRQHAIGWSQVKHVLEAVNLESFQGRYVDLVQKLVTAVPDIDMEDSHAIWSYLICHHCFGSLNKKPSTEKGDDSVVLEHSDTSRERLRVVWGALKLLINSSADEMIDPTANFDGTRLSYRKAGATLHSSLKLLAKGLLAATKGPHSPGFDPREPYREDIVNLVDSVQKVTAKRLQQILKICQDQDPKSSKAVRKLPYVEIRGLLPSAAPVRHAPERLRLDAKLDESVENVDPIPAPDWVLSQQIDVNVVNTLKNAGCIQKARELVDLVRAKSNVMSSERLQFSYLHTAWIWAFFGKHLQRVTTIIERQLGVTSMKFPCDGPSEKYNLYTILSFRARSEPKGIPRLLEKTREAIEEEVVLGTSEDILRLEPDLTIDPEDREGEQLALLELLTPGCYVCDILGAEVSVGSFKDLLALHKHLQSLTLADDGCQVVRTKNNFSRDAPNLPGGYRDLKLWLVVASGGFTVIAELQIHIHSILEQKKFMHLAYECYRGSYDHPHLADTWQLPPPPSRSCCASLCRCFVRRPKEKYTAKVAPEHSEDTGGFWDW